MNIEELKKNLKEKNINNKGVEILKVYLFIFLLTLMGCSVYQDMSIPNQWKYKSTDTGFSESNISNEYRSLISPLIEIYKSNPFERDYNEIVFNKVQVNSVSKLRMLIFDVKYVDDMQVVFILNEANLIIDNYLNSRFYE